jgi:septum formation inhibitor MinC
MEKIKLNISGNLVSITLPTTETFLRLKEQLKKVILKNYRLVKSLKFYRIDNLKISEEETLELERLIEAMVPLKNINNYHVENKRKEKPKDFRLHYGNLRSGEKIVSDTNLIILGNLNPGSYVKSKKSVFDYGKARGTIYAGSDSDKYQSSYIYIEEADKPKIRIGNKQILYDEITGITNLLFEKKSSVIKAKKMKRLDVQGLLKKIGFDLI